MGKERAYVEEGDGGEEVGVNGHGVLVDAALGQDNARFGRGQRERRVRMMGEGTLVLALVDDLDVERSLGRNLEENERKERRKGEEDLIP